MTADKPRRLPRFSLRSLILFVTLAGSGYGLWARWEPWVSRKLRLPEGVQYLSGQSITNPRLTRDEASVIARASRKDVYMVWDVRTGQLTRGPVPIDADFEKEVGYRHFPGLPHDLYTAEWGTDISSDGAVVITAKPVLMVTYGEIRVWHRRRRDNWWGVTWLPEFWLTVMLGVGLIVSVWRDQRRFRQPSPFAHPVG